MYIAAQWIIGSRAENAPYVNFYEQLYTRTFGNWEIIPTLQEFLSWWTIPAFLLSLFLMVIVVYLSVRLNQTREEQQSFLKKLSLDARKGTEEVVNERWSRILKLSESSNENDWRQAVMEADIMLDNMLTAMGHQGDTLGEKLKSVEKSDFTSIDQAWEAHKVRNAIAHEGVDMDISHRKVRRTIELYKTVFEEFHYI
ncbi:MAG: hypothetical protein WDZ70_01805 [Candidatus Paceibacterota bacterium]